MARFKLMSRDFEAGGRISKACTCEGEDRSPRLSWHRAPEGTACFALIVEDPDAPKGLFTHWTVYDVPASVSELPASAVHGRDVEGGVQGVNDFGAQGWNGPCPPPGDEPHHYIFRLYALDARLGLPPGVDRRALLKAMEGHVLATTELMATFGRAPELVGAR